MCRCIYNIIGKWKLAPCSPQFPSGMLDLSVRDVGIVLKKWHSLPSPLDDEDGYKNHAHDC